jgi:hypothetical protein
VLPDGAVSTASESSILLGELLWNINFALLLVFGLCLRDLLRVQSLAESRRVGRWSSCYQGARRDQSVGARERCIVEIVVRLIVGNLRRCRLYRDRHFGIVVNQQYFVNFHVVALGYLDVIIVCLDARVHNGLSFFATDRWQRTLVNLFID